ncbi:MAG: LPS export ABC transporter permease LptG [Desulfosarcina sp.]|nr:LPS export ABC transporter permease LptG [Desulfobacterales bacterium]
MTIIDRYIIREITRYLLWVLLSVTMIYIIADFFDKIDNLLASKLPFAKAALFFISRIPFEHLIPASTLLSVLVVFGLMNKHNELTALKTSGVSIYRCIKAPLIVGVVASLFLILCAEMMLPILRSTANRMWLEAGNKVHDKSRKQDVWLRGDRLIAHIRHFDPDQSSALDVSINFFDRNFRLIRRIEARRILFQATQWSCHDTMEQVLNPNDGSSAIIHHDQMTTPVYFQLDELKHGIKAASEMGVFELAEYIRTVASEGYDTTALRVDWQAKIAFPLVCVIMAVMAASIAGRTRRGDGLATVVVMGIGLAFCFWVVQGFSLALGYAAMLPPVLAAWIPNLIYAGTTAIFLIRAE